MAHSLDSDLQERVSTAVPLFCSADNAIIFSINSFQTGRLSIFSAGGVILAMVSNSADFCLSAARSGRTPDSVASPMLPVVLTPIMWSSRASSQTICVGGVSTIREMIWEGTPSSLAKRAIAAVATPEALVSRPPLPEALCTPISAPGPANFESPAANARKQAEAQTAPGATTVGN